MQGRSPPHKKFWVIRKESSKEAQPMTLNRAEAAQGLNPVSGRILKVKEGPPSGKVKSGPFPAKKVNRSTKRGFCTRGHRASVVRGEQRGKGAFSRGGEGGVKRSAGASTRATWTCRRSMREGGDTVHRCQTGAAIGGKPIFLEEKNRFLRKGGG